MTLLPPYRVTRTLPVNLKPDEALLFANETTREFPAVRLFTHPGAWVLDNGYVVGGWGLFPVAGWFNQFPKGLGILKAAAKILFKKTYNRSILEAAQALVVTDEFSNGYFHWIADCLPRLWISREYWSQSLLVLPSYLEGWEFVRSSLQLLGMERFQFLKPGEKAHAETVFLPEKLAHSGNYHPPTMKALGAHLVEAVCGEVQNTSSRKRLYISRKKAPWRKLSNEARIEEILDSYGFESVCLEDLSWTEQIRLLNQAETVVGLHGAGLTNMLFMPEGSRVLELRRAQDAHNNCYFSLASALGMNYFYLSCHPVNEGESTHTANLWADPDQLRRELDAIFGSVP